MHQQNAQAVRISVADPGPMGLFGLAMVTLVASSQKLGLTSGLTGILPWAIFLGGLAQLYASFSDSKLNNTFGATAFGAYGFFWLGVSMTWLIKLGFFGEALMKNFDGAQLGVAYLGYLIFTLFMTVGSATTNKVLFVIFVLIDFLFIGLVMSSFEIMPKFGHNLAAYSELLIALLSFYGSGAAVINSQMGRTVLPLGKAITAKYMERHN